MIPAFRRLRGKVIPLSFLVIGTFLLMQIVSPVISFQFWAFGQSLNNQILVSPIKSDSQVLGISVQSRNNFPAFISSLQRDSQPNYDKFSLSIPRLKVENQEVAVDANSLDKGLVQLPGSALPGEKGNLFISGHSALSQFFAVKSVPFSKLPELKKGDQVVIETPGSKFIYEIIGFKIVDPSDLSVLEPPDTQGRYISMMTCVPPGLNFKRLVVLGKML